MKTKISTSGYKVVLTREVLNAIKRAATAVGDYELIAAVNLILHQASRKNRCCTNMLDSSKHRKNIRHFAQMHRRRLEGNAKNNHQRHSSDPTVRHSPTFRSEYGYTPNRRKPLIAASCGDHAGNVTLRRRNLLLIKERQPTAIRKPRPPNLRCAQKKPHRQRRHGSSLTIKVMRTFISCCSEHSDP